jgi:hypothetical protein
VVGAKACTAGMIISSRSTAAAAFMVVIAAK